MKEKRNEMGKNVKQTQMVYFCTGHCTTQAMKGLSLVVAFWAPMWGFIWAVIWNIPSEKRKRVGIYVLTLYFFKSPTDQTA